MFNVKTIVVKNKKPLFKATYGGVNAVNYNGHIFCYLLYVYSIDKGKN